MAVKQTKDGLVVGIIPTAAPVKKNVPAQATVPAQEEKPAVARRGK